MDKSGIIIIDKPIGKSSAFISRLCGKILEARKVGHLGTLDPFASGVLSIAINNATKLIKYIKTDKKVYEFEICFGEKRYTGDITGKVIEETNIIPKIEEITSIISEFIGEISQTPHIFSAIKVNGKRSYQLARRGIVTVLKERKITIFDMKLEKQIDEFTFKITASVSAGTYIRTLAENIAEKLGSVAYVKSLRRTVDGQFSINQSITVDILEKMRYDSDVLLPIGDVLVDIPVISVSSDDASLMRNGLSVPFRGDCYTAPGEIVVVSSFGFVAISNFDGVNIKPRRVFCV